MPCKPSELEACDERRLLADLIQSSSPAADADALAGELLRVFGSMCAVLEMPVKTLAAVPGMTRAAARLLQMIPAVARYTAIEDASTRAPMTTFARAAAYIAPRYIGLRYEVFLVLMLNDRGLPLACVTISRGTVDNTAFYIRDAVSEALRVGARTVVLSHNHPGGTPNPSPDDLSATVAAIECFAPLDIRVQDHIIVADAAAISLRAALRDRPESDCFARQGDTGALYARWLA